MQPDETGKAYAEYKAGVITLDEYIAALRSRSPFALQVRTPRAWRQLLYTAAGRGHLSAADIISLERNHGGTEG